MPLILSRADYSLLLSLARSAAPREVCGLLGGRAGCILRVYPIANVSPSPNLFRLDPAEQVRAMLDIERRGWELCAIYHSHPAGPPLPSETDIAQAAYPEAVYLIIAPDTNGQWLLRGFKITANNIAAEQIEIV